MLTPYFQQFQAVKKQIEREKWFKGWQISITYFPTEAKPDGVSIQLSKKNWFNDGGKGIHFETWVTPKEIKSKKLKFVMHVLHQDLFPGTDKKPWDFLWPFLECQPVIDIVEAWKGFEMGRSVPIKGTRKFEDQTTSVIVEAFSYFAQIGPFIDSTLDKIIPKT